MKKCDDSCKSCINSHNNYSKNCKKCKNPNYFLEEGNCFEKCSENYISIKENMTCIFKSDKNELLCPEIKPYLNKENNICVNTCKELIKKNVKLINYLIIL